MFGITMACVDDHFVAEVLQANCSIDDQSFCATNAKIWVEEDNVLAFRASPSLERGNIRCHVHGDDVMTPGELAQS
jgi:hypothetical protein